VCVAEADAEDAVPCRYSYAIRAQLRGGLKHTIAALDEQCWQRYDEYTEVAEEGKRQQVPGLRRWSAGCDRRG